MNTQPKLNALQRETILEKLVPLIAAENDREFFRGVLSIALENMNSTQSALFVKTLLEGTQQ